MGLLGYLSFRDVQRKLMASPWATDETQRGAPSPLRRVTTAAGKSPSRTPQPMGEGTSPRPPVRGQASAATLARAATPNAGRRGSGHHSRRQSIYSSVGSHAPSGSFSGGHHRQAALLAVYGTARQSGRDSRGNLAHHRDGSLPGSPTSAGPR